MVWMTSVWVTFIIFLGPGARIDFHGHWLERIVGETLLFGLWHLVLCSLSIHQTAVYSCLHY